MDLMKLGNLQLTLFTMILLGCWMKIKGIIDENGKRCLTDVCVNVVIPCNIIKACMIPMGDNVLATCGKIFIAAVLAQMMCILLNHVVWNRYHDKQKKVLQYGTLVSNGGFLGNPIAEGVYGSMGLLFASVFLIPTRMLMWSGGTSYFISQETNKKDLFKKVLTHPCLVAVYIGIVLMLTGFRLPDTIRMTMVYVGNCNAAMTMFIVGTILADVDIKTIINKDSVWYSFFRLLILPGLTYLICLLLEMGPMDTGVSVMLIGMPAGATTAIFAARYGSDAIFATKCVVLSTLLSMFTIPIWVYLVG